MSTFGDIFAWQFWLVTLGTFAALHVAREWDHRAGKHWFKAPRLGYKLLPLLPLLVTVAVMTCGLTPFDDLPARALHGLLAGACAGQGYKLLERTPIGAILSERVGKSK